MIFICGNNFSGLDLNCENYKGSMKRANETENRNILEFTPTWLKKPQNHMMCSQKHAGKILKDLGRHTEDN